jgi:hypothetical protein
VSEDDLVAAKDILRDCNLAGAEVDLELVPVGIVDDNKGGRAGHASTLSHVLPA